MLSALNENQVEIRDVSLRDGFQMFQDFVPTSTKKKWIDQLLYCGLDSLEVTSFISPKAIAQFKDGAEVLSYAKAKGVKAAVLVPNQRGAETALLHSAPKITFVISASNDHSIANVRKTTDEIFNQIIDFIEILGGADAESRPIVSCIIATSFGCSILGAVKESTVIELATKLFAAGADEISLADTVGFAHPGQVKSIFRQVSAEIPYSHLAAHFHDTRGLGIANVMAALELGVRRFDSAMGGLGGCPFAPGASGNVATEDTVFAIEAEGFHTGVDILKLIEARKNLGEIPLSEPLYGHLLNAGVPKSFIEERDKQNHWRKHGTI